MLDYNKAIHTVGKHVNAIFYAIVILFIIVYLKSIDTKQLEGLSVSWSLLLIGTVFGIATRYIGAITWLIILDSLGAKDIYKSKIELFYVYAKSWLGRYIPGTAPWILGKIYFASKHGISKTKLAISSILEASLQILTITILSSVFLFFDQSFNKKFENMKPLLVMAIILSIVTIIPKFFNVLLSTIHKFLKKKPLAKEHLVKTKTIIRGSSMYVVFAIFNGVSLFFIAKGIYPPLSYDNFLYVISVSNLAGIIGMLAIFVPSGIGVREGALVAMLAQIMPVEIAVSVAIITRVAGLIWDLIFFVAARLHYDTHKRRNSIII